jgi:hypothetical protein
VLPSMCVRIPDTGYARHRQRTDLQYDTREDSTQQNDQPSQGSEAHQGHTILPTPPHTESSVPVNSSVREKAEESTIGEASTSGHAWSGAAWHPSAPDRVCVLGSGRVSACKRFFERLYCVIGHVIGRPTPLAPDSLASSLSGVRCYSRSRSNSSQFSSMSRKPSSCITSSCAVWASSPLRNPLERAL